MHEKKKILIFIDWFLPGYKAGGPVRSMANMVDYLSDKYEFFIVTRNTDYTETTPYQNVEFNQWVKFNDCVNVFYASDAYQNLSSYKTIIESFDFKIAYINGIYSWKYSILPLFALKKFQGKKIVASRGMLAQSAIDVKSKKKRLFLKASKFLKLYKDVLFHATNEKEKDDVKRAIGTNTDVIIADNLPKKSIPSVKQIFKPKDELKLVSLARISPEKNTLFAIEKLLELPDIKGDIVFDLYGQIYDDNYWKECKEKIDLLPSNITVNYKGLVDADLVGETIQNYHSLFMPSRGENFGHVILESFMSGRPVIISDQTPWRGLESEQCGWDLALSTNYKSALTGNNKDFKSALSKVLQMEQEEFDQWCVGARKKAMNFINDPNLIKGYIEMFE